jgi:two-component sensor histidine kinase
MPMDLLAGDQDSLGLVLVTSLARQLRGKMGYSGNGGVKFSVVFPLE